VSASFDAALHRRLEAASGGLHVAVAVIDLDSHGIRALFASDDPQEDGGARLARGARAADAPVTRPERRGAADAPVTHPATATTAPPGFTVAPFAALALLARAPRAPAEPVALALERSDEVAMRQLVMSLDLEDLARAQIAFGLGNGTGLWRDEARGSGPWAPRDREADHRPRHHRDAGGAAPSPAAIADLAVGRGGGLLCSPLQLARAYATLATGKLHRLSLRADGPTPLEPHAEDAWSRAEPDFERALAAYAPHLDVVRRALRDGVADRGAGVPDLVGTCGAASRPRDGHGVTLAWCAGYGGEPALAFAVMAEDATRSQVLHIVRVLHGGT
jgi:hypothetical protein